MRISDWSSDVCSSDLRSQAVFAHRADTMGEEKPARIALDRASAIAHLDKLPGKFGAHKDRPFLVPAHQRVGSEQGDILAVLPPDHHISSIYLAREQSHALVPRGVSGKRRQTYACDVASTEPLG